MFNSLKNGIDKVIKKIKIKELDEKSLQAPTQELINVMIRNEIAPLTAESIGNNLKQQLISVEHQRFKDVRPIVEEALRKSIEKIITPEDSKVDLLEMIAAKKTTGDPFIILMLGINGTGKTTTLAKLGHMLTKHGYSVVFAAADTFRAGAIDQLTQHGDNIGIKTIKHQYGGDPAAVAVDAVDHAYAKGVDVVLVDTAGRMQNNYNLVRELEKIVRVTEPDLKIFVGDALAGNDVIRQATQFNEEIGIDAVIMTKLDSDVKGGAALSVTNAIAKPILYYGIGQGYDDLAKFDASYIAKQLI